MADSFNVLVNTSGLAPGTYTLDFYLTDGSGANDGNTSIGISAFDFGGGSASGSSALFGDASGSTGSSVQLTDSLGFGQFQQQFTAGSYLAFLVNFSGGVDAGGVPDLFAFLLDELNSNDPSGANSLLTLEFTTSYPSPSVFSATTYLNGLNAVNGVTPVVTPEPASFALLGTGIVLPWLRRRMNKRA
jgi:hypothetical protein